MVVHDKGPGLIKKEPVFDINAPVSVASVNSITVLKSNPRAKEGMDILKKIASLVAPIMRKYGWTLPLLGEFFPDQTDLLGININRGQKIMIRLRPSHAPDTFLDLETSLIGTMLHELTHNVHSAHDEKFYAFLDKLQDEYDEVRSGGYSGEGFLSAGTKLSTAGHDADLPMHVARKRALEAAQKRHQQTQLLGKAGGNRLGGASSTKGKTQREILAGAVERRLRDDRQCGHGEQIDADAEVRKAQEQSVNQIIDLTSSDEEDGPVASSSKSKVEYTNSTVVPPQPGAIEPVKRKLAGPPNSPQKPRPPPKPEWPCTRCTFLNAETSLSCQLCDTLRPDAHRKLFDGNGWVCDVCTAGGNDDNMWSCKLCGAIKSTS